MHGLNQKEYHHVPPDELPLVAVASPTASGIVQNINLHTKHDNNLPCQVDETGCISSTYFLRSEFPGLASRHLHPILFTTVNIFAPSNTSSRTVLIQQLRDAVLSIRHCHLRHRPVIAVPCGRIGAVLKKNLHDLLVPLRGGSM